MKDEKIFKEREEIPRFLWEVFSAGLA